MKKCPYCAESIQDEAIKCRFCNSMLTGAPPPANPLTPAEAAAAPAESVRILFEGQPSWKAFLSQYLAMGTLAFASIVSEGAVLKTMGTEKPIALVFAPILLVVAIVWYGILTLKRRATSYRITNQTIDIEYGILGRSIGTLQLWRVRDLDFQQTALERLLGIARIRIFAHDQTQPELLLSGLPGSRELFQQLRDAVALARQGRNVVGIVD